MNILHHNGNRSEIRKMETAALRLPTPKRIAILSGTVWLTVEGDARDYFPAAGSSMNLPAERLIVIQGSSDAHWQVQPIPPAEMTSSPN
jgi:hypothetical protein